MTAIYPISNSTNSLWLLFIEKTAYDCYLSHLYQHKQLMTAIYQHKQFMTGIYQHKQLMTANYPISTSTNSLWLLFIEKTAYDCYLSHLYQHKQLMTAIYPISTSTNSLWLQFIENK